MGQVKLSPCEPFFGEKVEPGVSGTEMRPRGPTVPAEAHLSWERPLRAHLVLQILSELVPDKQSNFLHVMRHCR